jgi:hypothetical protein
MPKPRSDGRFPLLQLAADRAPIYPAEDHQKKLPSGFAALATRTRDHDPLICSGLGTIFCETTMRKATSDDGAN